MRSRLASIALVAVFLFTALPAAAADPTTTVAPQPSAPGTSESEPLGPDAPEGESTGEEAASPGPEPGGGPEPSGSGKGRGGLTAKDRYIVLLASGSDVQSVSEQHGRKLGVRADKVFRAVRGFSAALNPAQRAALAADPSVLAVVPDEVVEIASQFAPTGVRRIGGRFSAMAAIDGIDARIDADVAIVDTGIDGKHPDLNVVGGYNCSTSDRSAWRDVHGHGTHVAGTVGAVDNGIGVVGVAPGVRLWAVKILNDQGAGLLSWYVCGLDWIASQRDPANSSRPLFEVANMSVAKWGADDGNCGNSTADILHQAICRLVGAGVTVVVAAGNDGANAAKRVPAAYDQVITVSALADTDGKAGGLGGNRCWSWGGYDEDDTFADFSNYGADVDIIAPGKCIHSTMPDGKYADMSGTSMATPHVTGAAALYKATRPWATPAEVREALRYLGTSDWDTSTDPDGRPEPLLNVGRIGPWGDFAVELGGSAPVIGEGGGSFNLPVTLTRSTTHFERVTLSATAEGGIGTSLTLGSAYGFERATGTLTVTVPPTTRSGTYAITVTGTEHGVVRSSTRTVTVENDPPVASPPTMTMLRGSQFNSGAVVVRVSWPAATDGSGTIAGYQHQMSIDGGDWGWLGTTATVRSFDRRLAAGHTYRFRVRARDGAGVWSDWAEGGPVGVGVTQDNWSAVRYSAGWYRLRSSYASGGTLTYGWRTGASARVTLTARQVALVSPVSSGRGTARIYVDGVHVASVSLYSASSSSRRVVWIGTYPDGGSRTFEVRLYGGKRFDIDAFVTLN